MMTKLLHSRTQAIIDCFPRLLGPAHLLLQNYCGTHCSQKMNDNECNKIAEEVRGVAAKEEDAVSSPLWSN